MNTRYSLLIASFAIIGSINATEHTSSPYYQEGYGIFSYKPQKELLILSLVKTFLQKDPASEPFKEAFANLQLYMRGVKAKIEDTEYTKSLERRSFVLNSITCIIDASDLADALQSFGYYLQTHEVKEFFDLFIEENHKTGIAMMSFVVSKNGPSYRPKGEYYRLGQVLGERILNFLPVYAQGTALIYMKEVQNSLRDLFFAADKKELILRLRDLWQGFQMSVQSFRVTEQKPSQIGLFMTAQVKLIRWYTQVLVELIEDLENDLAPRRLTPEVMQKLGKIFIECGDELAKLS